MSLGSLYQIGMENFSSVSSHARPVNRAFVKTTPEHLSLDDDDDDDDDDYDDDDNNNNNNVVLSSLFCSSPCAFYNQFKRIISQTHFFFF